MQIILPFQESQQSQTQQPRLEEEEEEDDDDDEEGHEGQSTLNLTRPELIGNYRMSNFYRFDIQIPMDPTDSTTITYTINQNYPFYNFEIPGISSRFRWSFWSCNGWSLSVAKKARQKLGGTNRMWDELLRQHQEQSKSSRLHCMVGGGDQLYTDLFWKMDIWVPWLTMKSHTERKNEPFTPEMREAMDEFMFTHYINAYFFETRLGEAMASIPTAFIIDDHDIFDGWGSYPDYLHSSHVFQGIKEYAFKYWLLFQGHTNDENAVAKDGYFGFEGYSWLRRFGPNVLGLGLDTRFERTLGQIVTPQTYDMTFNILYEMMAKPSHRNIRHLVVFLGGPIVYPRLTYIESILQTIRRFKAHKTQLCNEDGPCKTFNNQFGEPELLDDLNDHWTAKIHKHERRQFVQRLQEFAKKTSVRVTFVGGDVHCCGVGRFDDRSMKVRKGPADQNHRLMYQIISSAIVNTPPPKGVITLSHLGALRNYSLDENTKEIMERFFERDVNGKKLGGIMNSKLLRRRNFSTFVASSDSLAVSIHAESKPYSIFISTAYQMVIPSLNLNVQPLSAPELKVVAPNKDQYQLPPVLDIGGCGDNADSGCFIDEDEVKERASSNANTICQHPNESDCTNGRNNKDNQPRVSNDGNFIGNSFDGDVEEFKTPLSERDQI
ncbi:hypothetical protein H4219_002675 [Mycoemilia scoparia]|uniref:PhoD-like phosphatase domain-containing protein n=1 Tax=Mycoemilia scoparia TaxID=417184 RepID=A0A9W8A3G0_9FUNG|nr:hypothetical protein H4219_002675 [Mycoemilia scoparia]